MEAGDPSVSLDLLIRSLLILGASQLSRVTQFSPPVVIEISPPPRVQVVASAGFTRPDLSLSFSR
jgi:hypothetical protein